VGARARERERDYKQQYKHQSLNININQDNHCEYATSMEQQVSHNHARDENNIMPTTMMMMDGGGAGDDGGRSKKQLMVAVLVGHLHAGGMPLGFWREAVLAGIALATLFPATALFITPADGHRPRLALSLALSRSLSSR
jgi:hypothetical protein